MKRRPFRNVILLFLGVYLFLPLFLYAQDYPDGTLLRSENDMKVYVIHKGQKRWMRNIKIFDSYQFDWSNVQVVSQNIIDEIRVNKLVREKNDVKVYVLNDAGFRRHIPNPDVFNSYEFDWSDVAEVSQEELSDYQESYLVKEASTPAIYYLEGGTKRLITSVEAFYKNEFNWDAVSVVNTEDIASYQEGDPINPEVKIEKASSPTLPVTPPSVPAEPVAPPVATSTPLSVPSTPATPAQPSTPAVPAQPTTPASATSTPPSTGGGSGGSGSSTAPAQPATPAEPAVPSSPSTSPPAPPSDTTSPKVWLTSPAPQVAGDTTVFGTSVTVSADASDNVGVVGVQFKIDGANLGEEDTTTPYSISWDTTKFADGSYKLSAVARDAAGNTATSAWTGVKVNNAPATPQDTTPPTISKITVYLNASTEVMIEWATNEPADSLVMYGTTSSYGNTSTFDVSLTAPLGHTVRVTGLEPNTLYHFKVSSKDYAGNESVSGDDTFTTPAAPATTIVSKKSPGFFANLWWAIRDLFKKIF